MALGDMVLMLLGDGALGGRLGSHRFSTDVPLKIRHWYRVTFAYDPTILDDLSNADDYFVHVNVGKTTDERGEPQVSVHIVAGRRDSRRED